MAVVALTEAFMHPTIALLHSLVCHIWYISSARQQQQPQPWCQQAAPRGNESGQNSLQDLVSTGVEDVMLQPQHQLLFSTPEASQTQAAVQQQADSGKLHRDKSEEQLPLQQTGYAASQRCVHKEEKPVLPTTSAHLSRLTHPDEHLQSLLLKPAEQKDTCLLKHIPRPCHASARTDVQMLYLKMVICAILLSALPFVAWLKQPMRMRERGCWQDALPAAVLAVHASFLVLLVSLLTLLIPQLCMSVYHKAVCYEATQLAALNACLLVCIQCLDLHCTKVPVVLQNSSKVIMTDPMSQLFVCRQDICRQLHSAPIVWTQRGRPCSIHCFLTLRPCMLLYLFWLLATLQSLRCMTSHSGHCTALP